MPLASVTQPWPTGSIALRGPTRLPVRRALVVAVAVGTLAVAVRMGTIMTGAGPFGMSPFYDDGVYYAASSAVTFGRLPYRDFVLLHPPGIVWALQPFTWLGRVTDDPTGMAAARVAWTGLGGLNAALVVMATRRFGLVAALCGGFFYALWPSAILVESSPLLEPLGTLTLLTALALLSVRDLGTRTRMQVAAGAALGLAPAVKIWWAAPVLVVLGYGAVRYGRGALLRMSLGAAAAASAVCLPFFLAAPGAMWRMVVLDQLGRGRVHVTTQDRLSDIGALWMIGKLVGRDRTQLWALGCVLLAVLVVACVLAALTSATGRLYVVLTAVVVVVLLTSPSFFRYYSAFSAPMFALVLAAAIGGAVHRSARSPGRIGRRGVAAVVAAVTVTALVVGADEGRTYSTGRSFPGRHLRPVVASSECVTADSPWGLIALDVLSRDFRRGCRVEIDVSGVTHDTLRLPLLPDGSPASRTGNKAWKRYLFTYLGSGESTIILRAVGGDGFTGADWKIINSWPVRASKGSYRIYDASGTTVP